MVLPLPCKTLLLSLCLLAALFGSMPAVAQSAIQPLKDTTPTHQPHKRTVRDTLRSTADTTIKTLKQLPGTVGKSLLNDYKAKAKNLSTLPSTRSLLQHDTAAFSFDHPFRHLLNTRPLLKLTGGYVSYQFNYRSAVDTPYIEKDIAQHNVTGNLSVMVAGRLPLRVTWWTRQSNSALFRDMTDVQVSFDPAAFRQQLQGALQQRLLAMTPRLNDSLTGKLYELKKLQLADLNLSLLKFTPQSLVEAHELIRIPHITWREGVPDSVNARREDSLRKIASQLLDLYTKTKLAYARLTQQADSLKGLYQQNQAKVQRFRTLVTGRFQELSDPQQWKNKLHEFNMDDVEMPRAYRWLMGVRQFSVGRSVTNYSELTVKNTSVNGVNLEYNSWYYFAVSAGLVDYRYRDFVVNGFNKKPQYLYLLRAGIGRLEKNYFILSAFRGQKQLFPSNGSKLSVINITGFSAEGKIQLNATTHLTAEVAKSLAPDFRNNPAKQNTRFSLSDPTNQAFSVKAYAYLPKTGTRLEGYYKHTGANFQSFSSFQTNNALESWMVKAEQSFFKRKLRLAGSLRKNEFTNPFLQQSYSSNTLFKSLTGTFKMRKWPVLSVGYQPMSQLTALDSQVIENRFQSLTASAYHFYQLGSLRMASTLVLNQFYNNNRDTGFVYYNATNLFGSQQFFFNAFTAQVGCSYTSNGSYRLVVMDEGIQWNLRKMGSAGFGVKINSLNNELVKTGVYVNANLRVYHQDYITLSYDHGYLPGFNKGLVANDMATVGFVKSF